MADEQTAPVKAPETRAARLQRLLLLAFPKDAERIRSGNWGKAGPPYHFKTGPNGQQKLIIEDAETEERMGFVGTDRDDLLNQLEARIAPSA